MPIMLPLTLIGVGYLIYQLFAGATRALPIALAVAAGAAVHQLGCSMFTAFIVGVIAFVAVIMASQSAALMLTSTYARGTLAMLFAVPAALAGFSCAHALAVLAGSTGLLFGLFGAIACGAIAAYRTLYPAIHVAGGD